MNEFELISHLSRDLNTNQHVVVGAGDDCAILDLGGPDLVLFKTDAVVEGIHFEPDIPGEKVGRKALARCLSDIAAMAGTPVSALITLALPRKYDLAKVEAIYRGLNGIANEYGVAISGGETTTNPERILLSIALMGTVPREKAILRSGAKVGDAIFVTGSLGGTRFSHHLEFHPRIKEALWLRDHFELHSMMDLSDGLAGDLPHILKASGVGAELLAGAIPISRNARLQAREESSAKSPLLAALSDGEDFELLFTVASKAAVKVLDGWKAAFPSLNLSCIGKIVEGSGLRIRDKQGVRSLKAHGYVHLQ